MRLIKKYKIVLLTPEAIATVIKNNVQIKKSIAENLLFLLEFDLSLKREKSITVQIVNTQKPIPNHGPPIGFAEPYSNVFL
jgi:hypothetical protein